MTPPCCGTASAESSSAALLVSLLATPAAQAAIAFKGFSKTRETSLRSDLAKSLFPYGSLLDVVVRPRDLPVGALGLAGSNGTVYLDPAVFGDARIRAFALLHELSHQIDFRLLTNEERGRYYEAAGFGAADRVEGFDDVDWYDGSLPHDLIPAEQWASAVPLVAWPASRGNPFVGADGSCTGWDRGEGCAAPLPLVREILDAVLARAGLPPLGDADASATPVTTEQFVPPRTEAPPERRCGRRTRARRRFDLPRSRDPARGPDPEAVERPARTPVAPRRPARRRHRGARLPGCEGLVAADRARHRRGRRGLVPIPAEGLEAPCLSRDVRRRGGPGRFDGHRRPSRTGASDDSTRTPSPGRRLAALGQPRRAPTARAHARDHRITDLAPAPTPALVSAKAPSRAATASASAPEPCAEAVGKTGGEAVAGSVGRRRAAPGDRAAG